VPRIVITLPAYRAERTLAQTVADIPPGVADRLILVDDASPDNTAQLARELGIDVHVHRENLGYGGNQKTCYTEALASGADVVVLLHPDYQYEPKAVPLLIAPILAGDADMTFGSRFAGLGDPIGGGMPIYRYVGNRLTTIAENLMLGSRFTELHSGLRAYTRRCLLSLPFLRYSDDFLFDSQLLIDAVTSGQRVVEVPIPTRYTLESSSIAIDRSLAYIAGTLAYCARLAAERGRRGRRSPVVAPSAEKLARRRAPGEITPAAAAAIVEVVGGYFVPGDRLLALGAGKELVADLAQKRGWEPVRADGTDDAALPPRPGLRRASEHDRIACIVAFLDGAGAPADAADELERARSLLDREGLLVIATYGLAPQPIQALVKRMGFELVEWIPAEPAARLPRLRSRPDSPGADMAVARVAKTVMPSLA
jgi:Glycosyl transferase family 2